MKNTILGLAAAFIGAAAVAVLLPDAPRDATGGVPLAARTPGALNPAVTQATIDQTICKPGWTYTVRPPLRYTDALKQRQIAAWGYAETSPSLYEEDHFIPLELGGAPTDARNLWPQPVAAADGWTAARKDVLETTLRRLVCSHNILLDDARKAVISGWPAAYTRYVAGAR